MGKRVDKNHRNGLVTFPSIIQTHQSASKPIWGHTTSKKEPILLVYKHDPKKYVFPPQIKALGIAMRLVHCFA